MSGSGISKPYIYRQNAENLSPPDSHYPWFHDIILLEIYEEVLSWTGNTVQKN